MRAIPEDVANGEDLGAGVLPDCLVHVQAVLKRAGEGLLAHDVQTQRGEGNYHVAVHLVQDADEGAVDALGHILLSCCHSPPAVKLVGHKVVPVRERLAFLGLLILSPDEVLPEAFSLVVVWLSNGGD